ncbi:hypothetical protein K438DRAFT_1750729 [Mycena galopus ATCC 62051]|nr:hypothetical protein K438DRAFT_1750729 [Mycena galopus ATCC 62051]
MSSTKRAPGFPWVPKQPARSRDAASAAVESACLIRFASLLGVATISDPLPSVKGEMPAVLTVTTSPVSPPLGGLATPSARGCAFGPPGHFAPRALRAPRSFGPQEARVCRRLPGERSKVSDYNVLGSVELFFLEPGFESLRPHSGPSVSASIRRPISSIARRRRRIVTSPWGASVAVVREVSAAAATTVIASLPLRAG